MRTKLTKSQSGKETKAKCQMENKAMKLKLKIMLRGKEKKKTKARSLGENKGMKTKLTNMLRGKERKKE